MAEPHKKSAARDTFESLIVTVILAVFGTTFVIQAFKIPTGSMENTLLVGDHLLVNKFAFAGEAHSAAGLLPYREIHRGDVLVFKFPGAVEEAQEPGEHFVKRVIGVPGDHIKIVHRQVFVNGQALEEPYVHHDYPDQVRPGDDFPGSPEFLSEATPEWAQDYSNHVRNGELVVPPDSYFMMGDNREHSWDSRFWGFVPRPLVSGRPLLIYWSFATPEEEYTQTSFSDRVSQTADLVFHFFSKTRWRRTFRFVR
ncbi:MAG TPA: signal peptidase I [Terriglobia bacterium]|nr:signal peptidase I [Terriglobia bacterium]